VKPANLVPTTAGSLEEREEHRWTLVEMGPSILPSRNRAGAQDIAPFASDRWPTTALGTNASTKPDALRFSSGSRGAKGFPVQFRRGFKRAAWTLMNEPFLDSGTPTSGQKPRKWLAATTVVQMVGDWARFSWWLDGVGVADTLGDLEPQQVGAQNHGSSALLKAYATDIEARTRRGELTIDRARSIRKSLARLHIVSLRCGPAHFFPKPPWLDEDNRLQDSTAPTKARAPQRAHDSPVPETATAPISAATMSPLCVMSIAWIDSISNDVLAAKDAKARLLENLDAPIENGSQRAREILSARDPSLSLPATQLNRGLSLAGVYLVASAGGGCSPTHMSQAVGRAGPWHRNGHLMKGWHTRGFDLDVTAPQPVGVEVRGRLLGAPWIERIDFCDISRHIESLTTACLVVLAYFTGMRPHEVLGLPFDVLRVSADENGHPIDVVRATTTKNRQTPDGASDLQGHQHEWPVFRPATQAIRILQALRPGGHGLFSVDEEVGVSTKVAADLIRRFVQHCNEISEAAGKKHLCIPDDRNGPITLSRFRKTLAWHLVHFPDGVITGALTYDHLMKMHTAYGASSKHGLTAEIDDEVRNSKLAAGAELRQGMTNGMGVSGPAASEFLFRMSAVGINQERRMKRDALVVPVHDNPRQSSMCLDDPHRSACLIRSGQTSRSSPDPVHCVSDCSLRLVTDNTIVQARAEISALKASMPFDPLPMRIVKQNKVSDLQHRIEQHEADRKTLDTLEGAHRDKTN